VLAVVFGEHKESAFATAGVDRLLVLEGEEFSGYAPEQRVQGLRAVDNQFARATGCCPTAAAVAANWAGAWPRPGRAPGDAGLAGQGRRASAAPVPASKTCSGRCRG
jgi:hypothetical protein